MDIGYVGAFLGGAAAIFSPCAALLLPAFFAYAFSGERRTLVSRTGLFYFGLLLTLVPLGVGAGALGGMLTTHRSLVALIGGLVLIGFGVLQALGVGFKIPGLKQHGDPMKPLGAVLLGMTYGLAGACTGPLLGAVLTVAAVESSMVYGAILLAVFGAGMVVPLLFLALLWERFRLGERLKPRPLKIGPIETSATALVSGGLFILVGVLFLSTDATAASGGLLDATASYRLEGWLRSIGDRIPDLVFLVLMVAVGALLLWRWLRPKR